MSLSSFNANVSTTSPIMHRVNGTASLIVLLLAVMKHNKRKHGTDNFNFRLLIKLK